METVVLKIGGGILRNKDCFDRVVSIVRNNSSRDRRQIIVISALYGITDFLIESTKKSLENHESIESMILELRKSHFTYLDFIMDKEIVDGAKSELNKELALLERFLYGVGYLKELSPRSKDMIQSFGERLSPIILEAFLNSNNVDAEFVDAKKAGIYCKGSYENAICDMGKTKKALLENILPLLENKVVLLPGYYGIDNNGDVKTFGRGGTDYSSGVIANIFEAKLEVWKDVSGFMTADPKAVPSARQIDTLSYDEASELGYLGAKILHPKTIIPLREKNLEAEIKNLFAPAVKGTIICSEKNKTSEIIKSISSIKDVAIITVSTGAMVNVPGFASAIFLLLAEKEISVDLISTSESTISFSIDSKKIDTALEQLEKLKEKYNCVVSSESDFALIGVVGEGMRKTHGVAGRVFTSLGNKGVNIELISQGASETNITFVVGKKDLEKAVLAVHNEFYSK